MVTGFRDQCNILSLSAVIIDRLFRAEDVVIAFPQQNLHLCSSDSGLQNLL